jgi:O-antigen ligase
VKQEFRDELKIFTGKLRSVRSVGDFFELIPSSSLVQISFWLLAALVVSPLYILVRSAFLKYHDDFYLNSNQFTLGEYWSQYINIIGYSCLFLTFLIFINVMVKRKSKGWFMETLRRHPVPLFLFLMLVWSIFSYAFSSDRNLALHGSSYRHEGLLTYFAYAGIFCCGYIVLDKKIRVCLMKIFVLTATVLSMLMLINQPALNRLFSLEYGSAVFQNINHFGYYLCLAVMLAAALVLREPRFNKSVFFWTFTFIVLIYALIVNNSFGPYIAVVMGFIFLLVLTLLYARKSWLHAVMLIFILFALSFWFNMKTNYLTHEAATLSEDIVNIVQNNEKAPQAGSYRWILWVHAVNYILEKPVFGYGPENLFNRYLQDGINCRCPHNEILQLSATLGIPAALFYCCAIFFYFLPLLKNIKRINTDMIGSYSAIFAYLLSSMVGLSMFYTTPFYFAFLGLTSNLFHPSIFDRITAINE